VKGLAAAKLLPEPGQRLGEPRREIGRSRPVQPSLSGGANGPKRRRTPLGGSPVATP